MVSRNADSPHQKGDGDAKSNPVVSVQQLHSRAGNNVFKSGPLFISSKGIGWSSWKKRWFILTRTSLVFFRSDPNALSQKESDANFTLGGIDLNNSGSVVVRADKKLLTVLFPDGRGERAFTLKAETSEDMHEWKTALESALSQAPSAALSMRQNGFFQSDAADVLEGSFGQWRDRHTLKSLVVGRPILLALEDTDGGPSLLEKALRFVEQHGVKVEGILRQAADVDEVRRRVQEYEQGKKEFSPDEDAHVVGDCVKHILRELPSSPVPSSCCISLLEAFRSNRGSRVTAMRAAISDTLPEPNRRLLRRILKMMRIVASHKAENLMSISAVAACMAPLLLRPLLAGDCEVMGDFDMGGDGSVQFLQAAAAANHAQAIVGTLMEEFDKIFLALCSESDGSADEGVKSTDDETTEQNQYLGAHNDLVAEDNHERTLSRSLSERNCSFFSDISVNKVLDGLDSDVESHKVGEDFSFSDKSLKGTHTPLPQHYNLNLSNSLRNQRDKCSAVPFIESNETLGHVTTSTTPQLRQTETKSKFSGLSPSLCTTKSTDESNEPVTNIKRPTLWGHSSVMKNFSMECMDYSSEDEMVIQKLEMTRTDLQNKIAKEEKGNAILHASLERRKQALRDRRLALEQDVVRLQEKLQNERDLRATFEAGLNVHLGQLCIASVMDDKTRGELEQIALAEAYVINLKQKVADLHSQLNQQRGHNYGSLSESCSGDLLNSNYEPTLKVQQGDTKTGDSVNHCHEDPPYLPRKQPLQNQQVDLSLYGSGARTSLPEEPLVAGPSPAFKKANGNDEGEVATQSLLTKLTNRLNNLKERRSLLVNDLQSLETSNIASSEVPRLIGASQWMNCR
ncbi:hypothetical protein AAC387_Pa04g2827 [Persea americana]